MSDVPEMVERVARAMCVAHGDDPDQPIVPFALPVNRRGHQMVSTSFDPIPAWFMWTQEARAAIEAMREPTQRMCAACDLLTSDIEPPAEKFRQMNRMAIDIALGNRS